MLSVPIRRLAGCEDLALPAYQTDDSAGLDLLAAIADPLVLEKGVYKLIGCGIALAMPRGYQGEIRPRSGLAFKHGLTVLNAPGTIDADYRGEVAVLLINHGTTSFTIVRGMRIAQLLITPSPRISWELVTELPDSERGDGGFGHTGR